MDWRAFVSLLRLTLTGYTDGAVNAISAAWRLATSRGHRSVTPEHLLAGLATIEYGPSRALLGRLGLPLQSRATEVAELVGPAATGVPDRCVSFSPEVNDILSGARALARGMGHRYVSAGHLLLAMLSCPSSRAAVYLLGCGASEEAIRTVLAGDRA